MQRETYEWTSTWWEKSDDSTTKRVLLIGDSITRGYHPEVQKNLAGNCNVDMFSTSRFIADPYYQKEFELAVSELHYDCVHFNHGLHGIDFDINVYTNNYEKMLFLLLTKCKNVILTTSTQITVLNQPEELDPIKNAVVLERNKIVLELAKKYHLDVDDLYNQTVNRRAFLLPDGYHYTDGGYAFLGKWVADSIQSILNNR